MKFKDLFKWNVWPPELKVRNCKTHEDEDEDEAKNKS